jgi:hypothetical protein
MSKSRRDFRAIRQALEAKLCEKYPEMATRREKGLLTVEYEGQRFYIHHNSGVTSCDFEQARAALAAADLVITVGNGVRAA